MTEEQRRHGRRGSRAAGWAAGVLLLPPTVVAGARLFETDGVTPVPQLLALLPWLAVPAGLALLTAVAARGRVRWALGAWAAAVLAVTVWFIRPYGPDATGARGPVAASLRVLTSNVEFGGAVPALIEAARRERPQLLFVQECAPSCVAALTAALGERLPHRAQVVAEGSAGSVILSAFPLTDAHALPGTTLGMPGATARIGGRDVRLRLAHPLPPLPGQVGAWRRELGLLREDAAAARGEPGIVAGDFNSGQDHEVFRDVLDAGGLHDGARLAGAARTPSWPANSHVPPWTQLDHVLVGPDFTVRAARFLDLSRTDHRALLVELVLHRGR
ncbi:endonuclease/exonuclease/phosphatase family protein [Streptomyces sp. TRM49041]|uniref:endonuclease/exonuclease/phosphatase family protein n=1 Tax=Streptomyces sp. TRM49041 TaxID=2603216 RepID=UPI0021CCEFC4|nr:endonuclease/exonuclease/phosphatase family protein [Streptomyces sp. TRM49041]